MKKQLSLSLILFLVLVSGLGGCKELGQVDQGRVVAYDPVKKEVTIIQDKKAEPNNPDYDTLPPHVYKMPDDPAEIGALPKAGKRLKLDIPNKIIRIFDPQSQSIKDIHFTLIDQKINVPPDSPLVVGKQFPLVDRTRKTITVYSARQRLLLTFTVPDDYFAWPDDTWEAGDEVRIYYHKPGVAQRFMNITRTDIFKK